MIFSQPKNSQQIISCVSAPLIAGGHGTETGDDEWTFLSIGKNASGIYCTGVCRKTTLLRPRCKVNMPKHYACPFAPNNYLPVYRGFQVVPPSLLYGYSAPIYLSFVLRYPL